MEISRLKKEAGHDPVWIGRIFPPQMGVGGARRKTQDQEGGEQQELGAEGGRSQFLGEKKICVYLFELVFSFSLNTQE